MSSRLSDSTPPTAAHVALRICEPRLRDRLLSQLATIEATPRPGGSTPILITDQLTESDERTGRPAVLVCQPTAWGARCALDDVSAMRATSIVLADDTVEIGRVIESLRDSFAMITLRVFELAARVPPMSPRCRDVLQLVVAAHDNAEIASQLHMSVGSVKRDVAALHAAFGSSTRPALTAAAAALGVPTRATRPDSAA